jgi:hypothetical protein
LWTSNVHPTRIPSRVFRFARCETEYYCDIAVVLDKTPFHVIKPAENWFTILESKSNRVDRIKETIDEIMEPKASTAYESTILVLSLDLSIASRVVHV